MPKIGIGPRPELCAAGSAIFFISFIIDVFSAGSPGPFDSMIPSGFSERMSSALSEHGTIVTRQPRFSNSRWMLALAPKSQRTIWRPCAGDFKGAAPLGERVAAGEADAQGETSPSLLEP